MEDIKKAFQRVKLDIDSLHKDISSTQKIVAEENQKIGELCKIVSFLTDKTKNIYDDQQKTKESIKEITNKINNSKEFQILENSVKKQINNLQNVLLQRFHSKEDPTDRQTNQQTDRQINTTDTTIASTHISPLSPPKHQNYTLSTRNGGVPTDRQTDKPTDRQTENKENSLDNALEILNSLDKVKKEIRLKFKRLTEQEVLVFSIIYQLEEEQKESNYRTISEKLNLSESSIRDYVGRLIKKGIPVDKHKINNKNIRLSISNNLKKIATLHTILQLREL